MVCGASAGAMFKSDRAASTVEFALVAPFLFPFILCSIRMLYTCYVAVSLQFIAAANVQLDEEASYRLFTDGTPDAGRFFLTNATNNLPAAHI